MFIRAVRPAPMSRPSQKESLTSNTLIREDYQPSQADFVTG
jgi:hypothetical protein